MERRDGGKNLAGAGGAEDGGGGHGRRRSTISAAGFAGDRFGFVLTLFLVFDWGWFGSRVGLSDLDMAHRLKPVEMDLSLWAEESKAHRLIYI